MSEDETTPENDPFEEIVQNANSDESPELENIWDALKHVWPHFYEGFITKGIGVIEYMTNDGEKMLQLIHSPDMTPWDGLGLLSSAKLDCEAADRMSVIRDSIDTEDDDEGE